MTAFQYPRLSRRPRPLSQFGFARVAAIAAIFAAMEIGLIVMIGAGLYLLGGTRAYSGGESTWSKAQKNAILHLRDYIRTRDDSDLQAYQAEIAILASDREARIELDKPNPDMDRVRLLLENRRDPGDVAAMTWLFRTFRHYPNIEHAVAGWQLADTQVDRLQEIAATVRADPNSAASGDVLNDQLQAINNQVTALEYEFANSMAEAARRVYTLVLWGAIAATSLLLGFGSLAVWMLALRWRAADAASRARLETSEERLRAALAAGRLGSWEWDIASGRLSWSDGIEPILGALFEDSFSAYLETFVHPDDRARVAGVGRASNDLADVGNTLEFRICRGDGEIRWVASSGRVLRAADGTPSKFIGTLADITDRKRIEDEARTSEDRARLALDGAQAGIWDLDLTTGVAVWSDLARRHAGLSANADATFETVLRVVHPDDRAYVQQELGRARLAASRSTIDFRVVWSDSSVHHLTTVVSTYAAPDGKPLRMLGVVRDVTERRQVIADLQTSQDRLRTVLDRAPLVVFAIDSTGQITVAQGSGLEALGLGRDVLLGRCAFDLLGEAHPTLGCIRRGLAGEAVHEQLTWGNHDFECTFTPILDADGTVIGVSGVAFDVTERSRAQSQLEEQAQQLAEQAALLNLAHDGILVWELRTGAIQFWNRGAEALYGWRSDEVLGRTPDVVLHTEFPRPLSDINAELIRDRHWEGELVHTGRDGTPIVVASRWALQVDAEGRPQAVVAINSDVSERKKAEQALEYQARHDSLTALPNRTLMQESLAATLETLRTQCTPLALLLLDLDRFKDVNDTLGHGVGDAVLQQVAERLRTAIRPSDTVARFGGDEFAVLLPGAQCETALEVAARLRDRLSLPFEVNGLRLDVGASVGVALGPDHGQDAVTLLRRADVAMYASKQSGDGVTLYDPSMETDNAERIGLTADLRQALDADQLVLHYQPKIDADGHLVGVEALVRWQHPTRGLLGPDTFIPLAERCGIIEPLTRWVLSTARRQQVEWHERGLELTMAVNLSMRNVHDPALVDVVRDLLAAHPHATGAFELELTESVFMSDPARTHAQLARLRGLGVRIAVDDFGTGYSSLAYLKRLPVDELKIDRCFVRELPTDQRDRALVQATVAMAHSLGLRVVAEGVEDAQSLEILRSIGCDTMQGYHISRPIPAEDLVEWATNWILQRRSALMSTARPRAA